MRRTYNVVRITGMEAVMKPAVIRYTNPVLLKPEPSGSRREVS